MRLSRAQRALLQALSTLQQAQPALHSCGAASAHQFGTRSRANNTDSAKHKHRGSSSVLREDSMLARIMSSHPQLEEEWWEEELLREQRISPPSSAPPQSHHPAAAGQQGGLAASSSQGLDPEMHEWQQTQGTHHSSQAEGGEGLRQAAVHSTDDGGGAGSEASPSAAAEAAQRAADALFDTELAARMVQVASHRRHESIPDGQPSSSTSTSSSSSTRRRPRNSAHPYAPNYDIYDARRNIKPTLNRMLAKAGYYKRDLLDPRSLSLLRPAQLAEVCEECGIEVPRGTRHPELARMVVNLVALSRQPESQRPPVTYEYEAHTHASPEPHAAADDPDAIPELEEDAEADAEEHEVEPDQASALTPPPLPPLQAHIGAAAASVGGSAAAWARREGLLQEARYRQEVLQLIAPPRKIASWLSAARAQDVVTVYPSGEAGGPLLISGTAVSQRHAAACVEAVRWQVSQALNTMRSSAAPGSREAQVLAGVAAPAAVGLGVGTDWVALDAGHAEVHMLTAPARAYYQLEASYSQDDLKRTQGHAQFGHPSRVQRFRPHASTSQALTLDTIQADPAFEVSGPSSLQPGLQAAGHSYGHQRASTEDSQPVGLHWEQGVHRESFGQGVHGTSMSIEHGGQRTRASRQRDDAGAHVVLESRRVSRTNARGDGRRPLFSEE